MFNYFSWGLQIVISVILIKKGIMAKYFQEEDMESDYHEPALNLLPELIFF